MTQKQYIFYSSLDGYALVSQLIRNGKYGVILLTDEYQNYFSNQDSKSVPPWVIEQSAQHRKQRRLHLVSSQDYDQLVKAIRRRSDIAFKCRTYSLPFGLSHGPLFSVHWAYDAKTLEFDSKSGFLSGSKPLKMGFFFHSRSLRDSFDTYQVVFTGVQQDSAYSSASSTVNIKMSPTSPITGKKRRLFGKT